MLVALNKDSRADIIKQMKRFCPKCQRSMSKTDVFFCSYCGEHLSGSDSVENKTYFKLGGESVAQNVSSFFSVNFSLPKNFLKGFTAGAGIFMLVLAFGFLLTVFAAKYVGTPSEVIDDSMSALFTPKNKVDEKIAAKPNANNPVIEMNSVPTVNHNVERWLPFNTSLWMEFNKPSDFLNTLSFFKIENTLDLDTLNEDGLFDFVILVDPQIKINSSPSFTIYLFRKPGFDISYKEYFSGGFSEASYPDFALLSQSPEIIKEVNLISRGLKKSAALNSSFASVRNRVPSDTRAKIFVIADSGVGYVNSLDIEKMPEVLKSLVSDYLKSASYFGFLKYD